MQLIKAISKARISSFLAELVARIHAVALDLLAALRARDRWWVRVAGRVVAYWTEHQPHPQEDHFFLQLRLQLPSHLSLALESALVCHCMLLATSGPQHSSGQM